MSGKHIVACMRWGTVFPADYVNVLFNAMRENLTEPFEFVCLTTDATGLHPDITVMDIPDMGLPESAWRRGAWPKISMLKPGLFPDGSKILFVDLDSMIVGPMDEFFSFASGFHAIGDSTWRTPPAERSAAFFSLKRMIKDLKTSRKRARGEEHSFVHDAGGTDRQGRIIDDNEMGTGIFGYVAGSHTEIYEELLADIPFALDNFINEQHFIEHHLESWTPWRKGAVSSFKLDLRRPVLVDLVLPPRRPPASSPLLAFHGHPRPMDLLTRRVSRKEELPHVWFGPIGWFVDYWNKHNRAE